MKFGITVAMVHPGAFVDVVQQADKLGFYSAWVPEHLVFPVEMSGAPDPAQDHPPVPPKTPIFEPWSVLSYFAGKTEQIRLGTNVYLLALRHPFSAARAITTLDYFSGGRVEVGIGAGWLREEWVAAGLDPRTRGKRLDEAVEVCKRLWTEEVIEHHGEFYDFKPVMFEPKPIQQPHPPIYVGGVSDAALVRAAKLGDGWLGMAHTLETVGEPIKRLEELRREFGRSSEPFEVIMGGTVQSKDDIKRWEDVGVTHLISTPWRRTREAVEGLKNYADLVLGG